NGGCRHAEGSPAGTTSRWPFHASAGRSPFPNRATTLGRPSSPRTISGDPPRSSRISIATSATASSVPPGFSLGVVMSVRANPRTSSGSTCSTTAETTASSTMAANVPERRAYAPRGQPGPESVTDGGPGQPAGRGAAPARRGPPRPDAPDRTPVAAPGRDLVPGRSHAGRGRGPRGDGPARDAGGARARARGGRGARGARAGRHVRVLDPDRAVRRVGLGRSAVRAQRGRDRGGPRLPARRAHGGRDHRGVAEG